jgi:ligand-binding sensor domain-containing protein
MLIRLLYTMIFTGVGGSLVAQEINEKNFFLHTTKSGLSSISSTGIAQDKYGYIWVSTLKGLNRLDGRSFQQFYADSSQNSLPVDQIIRLKWLNDDELAVLTFVGLHIINTRTMQSRNLQIPPVPNKQSSNRVFDVLMDQDRNIFLINIAGFYQFNSKDQLVFRYDYSADGKLASVTTAFGLGVAQTEENTILLSTFHGPYIYYVDQKDLHAVGEKDGAFYRQLGVPGKLFMITHADKTSLSVMVPDIGDFSWVDLPSKTKTKIQLPFSIDNFQRGIGPMLTKLNDSVLIINKSNAGAFLVYHDRKNKTFSVKPEVYFADYPIRSFFLDKNKRLWIATAKGLLQQKRSGAVVEQVVVPSTLR